MNIRLFVLVLGVGLQVGCKEAPTKPLTLKTEAWNQALISRSMESLDALYYDRVYFYQKTVDKKTLLQNKQAFMEKYPDFMQTIQVVSVEKAPINDNEYEVYYQKETRFGGTAKTLQSVLTWRKINGQWLIVGERDASL